MEKLMVFGLAIWIGLMISAAPRTIKSDSQNQKASVSNATEKGERPHAHFIFYYPPE